MAARGAKPKIAVCPVEANVTLAADEAWAEIERAWRAGGGGAMVACATSAGLARRLARGDREAQEDVAEILTALNLPPAALKQLRAVRIRRLARRIAEWLRTSDVAPVAKILAAAGERLQVNGRNLADAPPFTRLSNSERAGLAEAVRAILADAPETRAGRWLSERQLERIIRDDISPR